MSVFSDLAKKINNGYIPKESEYIDCINKCKFTTRDMTTINRMVHDQSQLVVPKNIITLFLKMNAINFEDSDIHLIYESNQEDMEFFRFASLLNDNIFIQDRMVDELYGKYRDTYLFLSIYSRITQQISYSPKKDKLTDKQFRTLLLECPALAFDIYDLSQHSRLKYRPIIDSVELEHPHLILFEPSIDDVEDENITALFNDGDIINTLLAIKYEITDPEGHGDGDSGKALIRIATDLCRKFLTVNRLADNMQYTLAGRNFYKLCLCLTGFFDPNSIIQTPKFSNMTTVDKINQLYEWKNYGYYALYIPEAAKKIGPLMHSLRDKNWQTRDLLGFYTMKAAQDMAIKRIMDGEDEGDDDDEDEDEVGEDDEDDEDEVGDEDDDE